MNQVRQLHISLSKEASAGKVAIVKRYGEVMRTERVVFVVDTHT